MELLELLNRRKVSIERPRIRYPTDTRWIGTLIVGPRIRKRARGCRRRGYVSEGVHQVSELSCDPILLQVCNVVPGIIDTPLFKISPKDLVVLCKLRSYRCNQY